MTRKKKPEKTVEIPAKERPPEPAENPDPAELVTPEGELDIIVDEEELELPPFEPPPPGEGP